MSASNEIILIGDYSRYEEAKIASGQSIKPGMGLELNSSGEAIVVGTQGKDVPTRIALIPSYLYDTATKDTTYTAGEVVRYIQPRPGDLIHILCLSGQTINRGTSVIFNNAGKGIATTGTPAKTIGVSEEAAGTLGADTHVAVRIG